MYNENFVQMYQSLVRLADGKMDGEASAYDVLRLMFGFFYDEENADIVAQRVQNKFLTFSGAVDAPCEALLRLFDGDEMAAAILKIIPPLFFCYSKDKVNVVKQNPNKVDIASYCVNLLLSDRREGLWVVLIDSEMRILGSERIADGSFNSVGFTYNKLPSVVLEYKAPMFVLAHNHVGGIIQPSEQDIFVTEDIRNFFKRLDCELIEHYIISGNAYVPLLRYMNTEGRNIKT